jgi:quaternary ammonium compound-resistance protein SugE
VLPLGTAYAVWTGIGAVGSVTAGLLLFGEALGPARLGAILAILGGVVALKLLPA